MTTNAPSEGQTPQVVQVLRLIETLIVRVFMVEPAALSSSSRGVARVAFARQVGMYLGHVICGLELTVVGRGFGRDRSTVAHACCVVEDERDNPSFDMTLDLLVGILRRLRDVMFPAGVEQ